MLTINCVSAQFTYITYRFNGKRSSRKNLVLSNDIQSI